MGILDWLGVSSSNDTKGPAGMPYSPNEGGGLTSWAAGAYDTAGDYLETAKNAALPAMAQSAALGMLDGLMDDAPGKGEFFVYQPPGTDPETGKATPRQFAVTPLGWGAVAAVAVLVWMTGR